MNTIEEIFAQSSDAVFSIDTAGRIRSTNRQFDRLMGYSRNTLCGSWCAEILCGTDIHGQPFCGTQCPIPKTAPASASSTDFDLVVKRANRENILVNIGVTYVPTKLRESAGQADIFFSMRQVNPQRLLERIIYAPATGAAQSDSRRTDQLTSREKEVLNHAAMGMNTSQIARRMSISTQTVRTHFKNIYPKLGVNNRVEAVLFALEQKRHN